MASGSKRYSDTQILSMIVQDPDSRKEAIEYIYQLDELKGKVASYVIKHGGQQTDVLDVFHDGIVVLDRNIRTGKFRSESSIEGYLYSICRFLWNNQKRKLNKIVQEPTHDKIEIITPEISLFATEKKSTLRKALELLDDSCRLIIKLWKLSYSMEEIAGQLSLSSARMAKKYRYRCMKKLMIALKSRPDILKLLMYERFGEH